MPAPLVIALFYALVAFLLRVLLTVLKKLLNKAAKVTVEIVKKDLIPFLKETGAYIAQEVIEFVFSFAAEVAADIRREQNKSTNPQPNGSTRPTAPSQGTNVGAWYEVYTKKQILFKSVICKVLCYSNQVGGATGKKGKKAEKKNNNMWDDLTHLRQKAVQVIFALVDIVMDHKCPIKAEVIFDIKTKKAIMVEGANPPRHKFMETPGGEHRVGADILIVANPLQAPEGNNILRWVEIKFLDSDDHPDRVQMRDYGKVVPDSKLAMIRVSANPKNSDCTCTHKAPPSTGTDKPKTPTQRAKTAKQKQLREIWDIILSYF